jgi:hypothetical protein
MTTLTLAQLLERRLEIGREITGIETMIRGSLNEYYYNEKRKDGSLARRGPFYNITVNGIGNKTKTRSVPKKDLERVRQEVDNYQDFRTLTEEYANVCENIFLLTQDDDDAKKN